MALAFQDTNLYQHNEKHLTICSFLNLFLLEPKLGVLEYLEMRHILTPSRFCRNLCRIALFQINSLDFYELLHL